MSKKAVAADHKVTITNRRRITSYDVMAACTCGWYDEINTTECLYPSVAKAREELRYRKQDHLDELLEAYKAAGNANYYTVYVQPTVIKLYK